MSYIPPNFPRYDIESGSFHNMPTRDGGGDAFPFDDFLVSSPIFNNTHPPSLSTSSSYSTTSASCPITPTQSYNRSHTTPPQAQWNAAGGGGGGGARVDVGAGGGHFQRPFSLPLTPVSSPNKPTPQNYERAQPPHINYFNQPPTQPWNRQLSSLPPQGSTLVRKERPPVPPEILKHQQNLQKELAVHQSKTIPSVVPRTEKTIRFVYTLEAQLPPPLGLKIEGVAASSRLPLLPPLEEPYFSMVFTHTSWSSTKKRAFADPDGDALYDYERLEHLGDALLSLITTELIQDLFPRVTPGGASVLRANLVNNKHALSALATSYHLHTQLRASPAQVLALKLQPTVRSQLFEAYLAAISEQCGFQMARMWLREVMTPIATAGYLTFKAKADEDARPKPGDADHQGYTAMLIEWGKLNEVRVECVENDVSYNHKNQKIYSFSLRVERGRSGDAEESWYAFGPAQASQKKVAKNNVSYAACRFLGITHPLDAGESISTLAANEDVVAL